MSQSSSISQHLSQVNWIVEAWHTISLGHFNNKTAQRDQMLSTGFIECGSRHCSGMSCASSCNIIWFAICFNHYADCLFTFTIRLHKETKCCSYALSRVGLGIAVVCPVQVHTTSPHLHAKTNMNVHEHENDMHAVWRRGLWTMLTCWMSFLGQK